MITFPSPFTATKFPGYFWNTETHTLFSIKVQGILRELKITQPNHWNNLREPAYRVSHNGRKRWLHIAYLESLDIEDSEILMVR